MKQRGWLKKNNDCFWMENIFVWRVTYICVHVKQAQILPTSSKHVSLGMHFLGLGIGGLSHQSCMSLHIGTNNIVGGSMIYPCFSRSVCFSMGSPAWWRFGLCSSGSSLVSRWRDDPLVREFQMRRRRCKQRDPYWFQGRQMRFWWMLSTISWKGVKKVHHI